MRERSGREEKINSHKTQGGGQRNANLALNGALQLIRDVAGEQVVQP